MKFRAEEGTSWQPGWWMANIWLLFLIFPVLTVLFADLSTARRVGGLVVLAIFAVLHALGYRALIWRELGLTATPSSVGMARLIDPKRSELWFGLLTVSLFVGWLVAGWGLLGALPFLVSFAIFNFSWRIAATVFALCLGVVLVGPLATGRLEELWYLIAILFAAGAPSALARFGEEHQHDVNALNTQLMITEERERVARDVHDVLGHSLTAVVLKTQVIDRILAKIDDPSEEVLAAREQLAETQDVSRKALTEIRATVSGLRSVALGDELAAARSVLSDADVDLIVHGDPGAVPHRHHLPLGMTVREAVTNIVRHAEASRCSIELGSGDVLLAVRDDGVGVAGSREGNGLTGLRERLANAGLDLHIDQVGGTSLVVTPSELSI